MEQLSFSTSQKSRSRVIASSGVFQIELLERVGEACVHGRPSWSTGSTGTWSRIAWQLPESQSV